jgi:phytoene desaturase
MPMPPAGVRDERLRMALSFHPLFIGGDPFNVTSMYGLVSHLEGLWRPLRHGRGRAIAERHGQCHPQDQGGTYAPW